MRRLAIALSLVGSVAFAQPFVGPGGMPDPSKMSGIPRPDGQVPAGTLTVRLLRGDFGHPLAGQVVTVEGPGGARTATADASGRATLTGLAPGGPYVAKTTAFGQTMSSQPIDMPPEPGVRVMLVFPPDEKAGLGEPDGRARRDDRLPAGTVEVKVVDDGGQPLASATVVLGHAVRTAPSAGTPDAGAGVHVDEQRATTDDKGVARFAGLVAAPSEAYAVKVIGKEGTVTSEPFRLADPAEGAKAAGRIVGLKLQPLSRDLSGLVVGEKSHLILELHDEDMQVVENLFLENRSGAPIDPGAGGLRLPLADGAIGSQAQIAPEEGEGMGGDAAKPTPGKPSARIEGDAVVVAGRLPTGETPVQVVFTLPVKDGAVSLRQRTPIAWAGFIAITDPMEGLTLEPSSVTHEERTAPGAGGRNFLLIRGQPPTAGGEIYLRIAGLPQPSTWGRALATAVAALVVLWGLAVGVRRRPRADGSGRETGPVDRAALERRRGELLDELTTLERDRRARSTAATAATAATTATATAGASATAGDGKAARGAPNGRSARRRRRGADGESSTGTANVDDGLAARREALVAELVEIYRALDEAAA